LLFIYTNSNDQAVAGATAAHEITKNTRRVYGCKKRIGFRKKSINPVK